MAYRRSILLAAIVIGLTGLRPAIAQPTITDPSFQRGLQQYAQNQYAPALQSLTQALEVYRQRHDRDGERLALGNLGLVHEALKNYSQAITAQEGSLAIAIATKNRAAEAQSLANLANVYHRLNRDAKAIELIEQSLAIMPKSLEERGRIYAYFGAYPQAIGIETKRLAIVRAAKDLGGESKTLDNLGVAYGAIGNYPKAIVAYQQALLINRQIKLNVNRSLINLGDAYQKSGDNIQAIAAYEEVSDLYGARYNLNLRIKTLGRLGRTFSQLDQLPKAEAALKSAITEEDQFRRAPSLSDANKIISVERQVENHQLLQQILIRQNRTEAALEVAEQSRSRALVELLSARRNDADLAKAPNLVGIRRVAKDQNATLVEYSIISPELLYIWVVKPTGEIAFHITKLDPKIALKQLVRDTRKTIGVRGHGTNKINTTDLAQLYQYLIAPIVADLPKDVNDRVIFLPQGPLFLVPFAALQDAQGKYLIEQHAISTAPSIQTLELTHAKTKLAKTDNPLVVGDPTMPIVEGEQLAALPGARQEAIDVAKILNTLPLIGDQGTKAAVLEQMQTASIIHLATHGLLDPIGDIPGAVALAPQSQDSGLLTSNDIFDLKLQADLVVLSACDTGRGDITGDGVIGLSRSFIAAGVPSIVVSLWAVNDRSTNVLMNDFYKNLKINPNKTQALRKAMLTTMQQYPNPSDWAAFTLIGER
jgi:CHAT domain-containing protein